MGLLNKVKRGLQLLFHTDEFNRHKRMLDEIMEQRFFNWRNLSVTYCSFRRKGPLLVGLILIFFSLFFFFFSCYLKAENIFYTRWFKARGASFFLSKVDCDPAWRDNRMKYVSFAPSWNSQRHVKTTGKHSVIVTHTVWYTFEDPDDIIWENDAV